MAHIRLLLRGSCPFGLVSTIDGNSHVCIFRCCKVHGEAGGLVSALRKVWGLKKSSSPISTTPELRNPVLIRRSDFEVND